MHDDHTNDGNEPQADTLRFCTDFALAGLTLAVRAGLCLCASAGGARAKEAITQVASRFEAFIALEIAPIAPGASPFNYL